VFTRHILVDAAHGQLHPRDAALWSSGLGTLGTPARSILALRPIRSVTSISVAPCVQFRPPSWERDYPQAIGLL
jgi:hypothetical protein